MNLLELVLLSIGLAMDAFAVSICKGLSIGNQKPKVSQILSCGLWFGIFQMIMPLTGYILGSRFASFIDTYDHWVAFILLAFIGGKMTKEAFNNKEENINDSFSFKEMLILAVATSIDALAVGISFAVLPNINIYIAITLIGTITFLISATGVKIGNVFGLIYKKKAEILGGTILIILGLKILIEGLITR